MAKTDIDGRLPSARITDEIRQQIRTGELREGEPVPSTREITRRWGVAMATASKVLSTLQQEGLVRVVPGIGTVVERPAQHRNPRQSATEDGSGGEQRPPGDDHSLPADQAPRARNRALPADRPDTGLVALSRERIVLAGISIADREGLAALAMRRVAAELGTATMSLYRYVQSKDDLLMEMVRTVFERFPPPADNSGPWRGRIDALCRLQWAAYQRHPWLAQFISMTRPQLVPNAMAHTEWAMAALNDAGLDVNARLHVAVVLANYVRGLAVNLEPEAQAEQDSGLTSAEWMTTQAAEMTAILAVGAFPMFTEMITSQGVELSLDTLFEFGLARLLDGIAVFVDRSPTDRP